jgi:hypothetical protein
MTDSQTPGEGSVGSDDSPERPPRYKQVIRWTEYIKSQPPEVWGPQQNAVVNGQIESAQAVDVSAKKSGRFRSSRTQSCTTTLKIDGLPSRCSIRFGWYGVLRSNLRSLRNCWNHRSRSQKAARYEVAYAISRPTSMGARRCQFHSSRIPVSGRSPVCPGPSCGSGHPCLLMRLGNR